MKGIQGKWNTDGNDIPVRLAYRWARKVESKGAANFYRNSGPWDRTGFARDNDGISVEEEQASEDSLLNFYKRLIQLRAKTPALQTGSFRLLETKNLKVLGFERSLGKQKVDILLNLSAEPQSCPIALSHAKLISPESARTQTGASLTLKPHGYAILSQN